MKRRPARTHSSRPVGFIRNSNSFMSLFFQKKFSSVGVADVSRLADHWSDAKRAARPNGKRHVNVLSKMENKATADSSTGGVIAAPANIVYDTVAQFQQLQLDNATIAAACKGISLQVSKQGAAADYAMQSAAAQGMRMGKFTIDASKATFFFKDFTLYDLFVAQAQHTFSYRHTDAANNTYIFTLNKAVLTNPTITAGGPNQSVMADSPSLADPDPSYATLQIDRIAA